MASPVRDKDLLSIQQARALAAAAREAQKVVKEFSQEQVDRIVEAMADAARTEAEHLARLAHEDDVGRLDHRVGGLDGSDEPLGLDHSERFHAHGATISQGGTPAP